MTTDRYGRSIEAMENELAAAWTALDDAAAETARAHDRTWNAHTDAQEARAWEAWNTAREAQNRAARRLHDANTALGRPARDDRRAPAPSWAQDAARATLDTIAALFAPGGAWSEP